MFETKELYPPEDKLEMYPDNCGKWLRAIVFDCMTSNLQ